MGLKLVTSFGDASIRGDSAFEYMSQCVRDQVSPEISTIQDGYEAVRLIEAALQSAENGQWVRGEAT